MDGGKRQALWGRPMTAARLASMVIGNPVNEQSNVVVCSSAGVDMNQLGSDMRMTNGGTIASTRA
jgi:hypothetical protein